MSDQWGIIISVASTGLSVLIGVVGFLLREKVARNDAALGQIEGRLHTLELDHVRVQAQIEPLAAATRELRQAMNQLPGVDDVSRLTGQFEGMRREMQGLSNQIARMEGHRTGSERSVG